MTPKEAAIAVEDLLQEAGYLLGELTFSETVGGKIGRYEFSAQIVTTTDMSGAATAFSSGIGAQDRVKG